MAEAKKPDQKKASGAMPLIVAVVATLAIGFGTGFFAFKFVLPLDVAQNKHASSENGNSPKSAVGENTLPDEAHSSTGKGEVKSDEEDSIAAVDPHDVAFAALPPVVTNIKEPGNIWLRFEGGITFAKSGERTMEVLTAEVAQQVLLYLRTLKLSDISSPDGLQYIQDDLNFITRASSNGQVQNVLVTGLILE
jgi:flagellar basal body-associated protein FliL